MDLGPLINPVNMLSANLAKHVAKHAMDPGGMVQIMLRHQADLTPMDVDGNLHGAIFKSRAIPHLGLNGRFSDFVITLNGQPFKGREPIGTQPGWCEGAIVDVRAREEFESKPVGTT